jgi:U32 family peptidase
VNGKNIDRISKGQNVAIQVDEKVRPNDSVYKRIKKEG